LVAVPAPGPVLVLALEPVLVQHRQATLCPALLERQLSVTFSHYLPLVLFIIIKRFRKQKVSLSLIASLLRKTSQLATAYFNRQPVGRIAHITGADLQLLGNPKSNGARQPAVYQ